MVVINNVDSQRFSFNGVNYFKNFTPVVNGDYISILNTYGNRNIELTDFPVLFSDFSVDGNTFLNVEDLQTALLPVLFSRNNLGGSGGVEEAPNDGNLYGRKNEGWDIVPSGSNQLFLIKDEVVCTDVATNYYFRVNASGTSYTPVATSGTSPDFVTSLGQTNAYRYVDSFTLPYAVKLNKIVVIINNEFTYSFTLSFGYHLKNDATNSVSNPTSILQAAITKDSFRRFYSEYTSADFGSVTIPANHSLITGWFFQGRYVRVYFEVEKI